MRALSLQAQHSSIVQRSLPTPGLALTLVAAHLLRLAQFGGELRPGRADPRHVLLLHTEAGSASDQSQEGADGPQPHQDRRCLTTSESDKHHLLFQQFVVTSEGSSRVPTAPDRLNLPDNICLCHIIQRDLLKIQ